MMTSQVSTSRLTRFHFKKEGGGPQNVVLLPSVGHNPDYMRPLAEAWGRDDHTFIYIYPPGQGSRHRQEGFRAEEYAEELIELLDELGVREAHLVGHSMGGFQAALTGSKNDLLRRHNVRIKSVVVIDQPLDIRHLAEGLGKIKPILRLPILFHLIIWVMFAGLCKGLPWVTRFKLWLDRRFSRVATLKGWQDMLEANSPEKVQADFQERLLGYKGRDVPSLHLLSQLSLRAMKPSLDEYGDWLGVWLGRSDVRVLTGLSHYLFLPKSDQVAEIIKRFWEECV